MSGLFGRLIEPDQAANELSEEPMFNFLINTFDEEIDIELSENADTDSEDIWDVLVGSRAAQASQLNFNTETSGTLL